MKISPVQQKINNQRIRHHQDKIHREHLEYIKKTEQKRVANAHKGARIDVYA